MKDPTAKAAMRNIEGNRRFAVLQYREGTTREVVWLDPYALRNFLENHVILTADDGERHARVKEPKSDL